MTTWSMNRGGDVGRGGLWPGAVGRWARRLRVVGVAILAVAGSVGCGSNGARVADRVYVVDAPPMAIEQERLDTLPADSVVVPVMVEPLSAEFCVVYLAFAAGETDWTSPRGRQLVPALDELTTSYVMAGRVLEVMLIESGVARGACVREYTAAEMRKAMSGWSVRTTSDRERHSPKLVERMIEGRRRAVTICGVVVRTACDLREVSSVAVRVGVEPEARLLRSYRPAVGGAVVVPCVRRRVVVPGEG